MRFSIYIIVTLIFGFIGLFSFEENVSQNQTDQHNLTEYINIYRIKKLESLLEKLEKNDPFSYFLDLSEFKEFDDSKKRLILEALSGNKFAGNVKWNSELNDSDFKEEVEEKLTRNNFNYRRFSSDLIHCLLSSHVYKIELHRNNQNKVLFESEKVEWQKKVEDWRIHKITISRYSLSYRNATNQIESVKLEFSETSEFEQEFEFRHDSHGNVIKAMH